MYKCQKCQQKQPARTPQNKIVIETREKTYTKTITNRETLETKVIHEGDGIETVKEIAVCAPCAGRHEAFVSELDRIANKEMFAAA